MENQSIFICCFCNERKFFNIRSLRNHERFCKQNPDHDNNIQQLIKGGKNCNHSHARKINESTLKKERIIKCLRCGKDFTIYCSDKEFNAGKYTKYCSRSCANVRHHSEETKKKISKGVIDYNKTHEIQKLTKIKPVKYCKECGAEISFENISGYCKLHVGKYISIIKKGTSRWNIRRNQPSYAEKFFFDVLKNNDITYKFEYQIKKDDDYHSYYLDFFIEKNGKKIDLEIDGNQHLERKEEDKARDEYLNSKGFIVYRIKWNNINSENGKEKMKLKINSFLEFYNSL